MAVAFLGVGVGVTSAEDEIVTIGVPGSGPKTPAGAVQLHQEVKSQAALFSTRVSLNMFLQVSQRPYQG